MIFLYCLKDTDMLIKQFLLNSRVQILPLIENLEWLYIWGVVPVCLFVRHRPSVRPSVGRGYLRI